MRSLNDIKSWFKTGKFPTESQFSQTWDSFWHKAEKISMNAIENLEQILSLKADRDLVDRQVENLRNTKENVGIAREQLTTHNAAEDAHQELFDLKANDAEVYHREELDARFLNHSEDVDLHLQEGERESWNAHRDDTAIHKTSEQIRAEIVEGDIPATIARDSEVDGKITSHNGSGATHQDIRNMISNIQSGTTVVKKSEYAGKLGNESASYTKIQLDAKINKHIKNVAYNPVNAVFTFTFEDGTTQLIDTPVENTVKDGHYDSATTELVLVLISGQEIRIPAAGLVKVYAGKESVTTTTKVDPTGGISVDLKQGVIDAVHFSQSLLNIINAHQTKTGDTKDNVTTFTMATVRNNLVSGDKHNVLWGKMMKWLSDLGTLAFKNQVGKVDLDNDLQAELDGKQPLKPTYSWSEITDKPAIPAAETAFTIMAKINSQSTIRFSRYVDCTAGAGNSSDIRKKKDLRRIEHADDLLKNLKAYRFTYKETGKKSVNIIAQDLQQVFPELVHEDSEGFLMIELMPLISVLIEANNAKVKQLEKLEQRLTKIETLLKIQ